jgi:hypothetical protein
MRSYRFQHKRTRGWRKPPGGVCYDRSSRWGNPFDWRVIGCEAAVREYDRALLDGRLTFAVADVRQALSSRPFGCYCPLENPLPCGRAAADCRLSDLSPKTGATYFQQSRKQTAV